MNNNFVDLTEIIIRLGQVMPPLIMVIQLISGFLGVFLIGSALLEIWGASDANNQKYLTSSQRFSIGSAVIQIFIGVFLLSLSTLEFMGILTRSFTGNYVDSRIGIEQLNYSGNPSLKQRAQLALMAILAMLQAIGIIAIIKAFLTANGRAKGTSNASYGAAACWLIGGIICWNFKFFNDVLNYSVGFNILGLFPLLS